MIIVRWVVLLLLLGAAVSFAFYAGTGQVRFKVLGLRILRWTLAAAFLFFAVLILERIA
ncbi:hypothetical protein [Caenimonas sp. SL110]|uniref:hypothetical protein n=1 Tax=Caenimonas sp. SL110 TaxID=1450524 RepID=UPI000B0EE6F3|nr:hypothetical protein [Caenimonas sp. SL110]